MTKSRHILAPRRNWTEADLEILRERYANTPTAELAQLLRRSASTVYQKALGMGLRKSADYLASAAAGRLQRDGSAGVQYRFQKGHVPANKGQRRPGWGPGRMKETQFRKGERHGTAKNNWKPIGTELINRDGYLVRKISETGLQRHKWRPVHLLLWEEHHGKVPADHAVVFRNGDRMDVRLENLELLTRQQLMARNTVHNLPKAIAQVIQLRGALIRQINRRAKKEGAAA